MPLLRIFLGLALSAHYYADVSVLSSFCTSASALPTVLAGPTASTVASSAALPCCIDSSCTLHIRLCLCRILYHPILHRLRLRPPNHSLNHLFSLPSHPPPTLLICLCNRRLLCPPILYLLCLRTLHPPVSELSHLQRLPSSTPTLFPSHRELHPHTTQRVVDISTIHPYINLNILHTLRTARSVQTSTDSPYIHVLPSLDPPSYHCYPPFVFSSYATIGPCAPYFTRTATPCTATMSLTQQNRRQRDHSLHAHLSSESHQIYLSSVTL